MEPCHWSEGRHNYVGVSMQEMRATVHVMLGVSLRARLDATLVCAMDSDIWRFKYGIDKSKCMIVGKCPFTCDPVWRLNDVSLRNVETMEMLGNVFNSKGNNTSHVDNRVNKCRQSFYGLNSLGMSYPGAAQEVNLYLQCMSASFNLRHGVYE